MLPTSFVIDEEFDVVPMHFVTLARTFEDAKNRIFIHDTMFPMSMILEIGKTMQYRLLKERAKRITKAHRLAVERQQLADITDMILRACAAETLRKDEITVIETIICWEIYRKHDQMMRENGRELHGYMGMCGFPTTHEGKPAAGFMTYFRNDDDPGHYRAYIRSYTHEQFLQHFISEGE